LDTLELDSNQLHLTDPLYDTCLRSEVDKNTYVVELLPRLTGLRICEIGIGYAHLAIPLCRICADSSIAAIEAPTREYVRLPAFRKLIDSNNIDLRLADITREKFPFDDCSIDVIIFSEIMEHLSPPSLPDVFNEIYRCLRMGGMVIVSTPNVHRLRNRLRFFFGRSIFESPATLVGGTYGHIREYSHRELMDLLRSTGFENIMTHRSKTSYPVLTTTIDRILSRFSSWLAKCFLTFEDFVFVTAIRA